MMVPPDRLCDEVRAVCLSLPEAVERLSHGTPAFFATRQFLMLWPDGHHDHTFHLWCAAPEGTQEAVVADDPDRYFRPPYVGHRGWIGVRLDRPMARAEVRDVCVEAYRCVAPRRLVARLDLP